MMAGGLVLIAFVLLWSVFCAFTHGKCTLFDYGVYTSMIYNSGHGDAFHLLADRHYLQTHLSFSLALLGPLFHLWDHPFLLAFVQWLMAVIGAFLLAVWADRRRLPVRLWGAGLLFFLGYRFTQSVLLSEFHTVGPYFLLAPWLFVELSARRKRAWLPLALILGLREDAFAFLLPLLIYAAVVFRFRAAWWMVGASLAYGLAALFVLYPAINGLSIFERRGDYIQAPASALSETAGWWRRGEALLLVALPAAIGAGRRAWIPLLLASVGLLVALLSAHPSQQGLGGIYSAPVMTMLAVGLFEAWRRTARESASNVSTRWMAIGLAVATVGAHLYSGFLPLGGKSSEIYGAPSFQGLHALHAARYVPRDGLLIVDDRLAGYCGNRHEVLNWTYQKEWRQHAEVIFTTIDSLHYRWDGRLFKEMEDGQWGIVYGDGYFIVLRRNSGAPADEYAEFRAFWERPITAAYTRHEAGAGLWCGGPLPVWHWEGDGSRAPVTLCFGAYRHLPAGTHRVSLLYAAQRPAKDVRHSWGRFSLHRWNEPEELAGAEIYPQLTVAGHWMELTLELKLEHPGRIEPRVVGADAPLWLERVIFQ